MCPLSGHEVVRRGHVQAGGMIAADLQTGKFYEHEEIVDELAEEHPYEKWLEERSRSRSRNRARARAAPVRNRDDDAPPESRWLSRWKRWS